MVLRALATRGPRWFDGLARPLAASRWRAVTETTGLDRRTYGTVRYLAADASVPRADLASVPLPAAFASDGSVSVEALRGEPLRRYAGLGLDFHADGEAQAALLRKRLLEAFDRLAQVPGAAAAIGAVLAVLHVVRPEGPDYDVSYSDPDLPFSVFVGIDHRPAANGALRLAEGILHECMHLQLSLVEGTVPMVAGADERLHSPWQGTMRPVQGILHGLYVFRVIQDFHRALLEAGSLTEAERAYLGRRIAGIEEEAVAVRDLAGSRDLTPAGRELAVLLLAS
ncbi:HEXXH motif-containing putative peptide modification protein [Methylorubrum rhodesianum]|uniref:HEXXH motif-containing putative peptide modification protein n=1 Tax=Methylorubrum rhodesianum TaxID=29427 RepID=A0ABU9ZG31_9HYPH